MVQKIAEGLSMGFTGSNVKYIKEPVWLFKITRFTK